MNIKSISLLCLCFACSACFFRSAETESSDENSPALTEKEFSDKVSVLEKEVERLRAQLAGSGRGAYARGPRMITGQAGDETLLDRLYNAENGLKQAQNEIDAKNKSISILQQKTIANDTLIHSLELKAELYEKNRDKIATLQDNRKMNLLEMQDLRVNLVESELEFLKLQRRYFDFAREILELEPGDAQTFLELQDKIKLMTLELKPKKMNDSLSANDGGQS